MDGGQKVAHGFVVAGRHRPELLELDKEIIDQVPGLAEFLIVIPLYLTVGLGRYNCCLARLLQGNQDTLICIEAFVGEQSVGRNLRQQHIVPVQIAGLTACEMRADGVAQGIDRSMNLGTQRAFAASDGLVEAPFFSAPALCWCARTMVESIVAYSLSASAARCRNNFFQTLCHAQRLKRVWTTQNRQNASAGRATESPRDSDTKPLPRRADYLLPDDLLNPIGLSRALRSTPTDHPVTHSDARP